MNYEEAIAYIESFPDLDQPVSGKLGPAMTRERMREILDRLGDPHQGRKCAHITGSKGKGSTAAMMAGILNQVEGPTALFISPHVESYVERISIDGCNVTRDEFAGVLDLIKPELDELHTGEQPLAVFQILIALFFKLVQTHTPPPVWQVVEVGLGGANDPTNVFEEKELVVFTPIGLEHTGVLGGTIREIAENKAALITPGCQVIVGPQPDHDVSEALAVIEQRAREQGARVVDVAREYQLERVAVSGEAQEAVVTGPNGRQRLQTSMLGHHQAINAMTALAAVESIAAGPVDQELVNKGLCSARLPGRMEILGREPLVIADGAHTVASAASLYRSIQECFQFRRLFLIVAFSRDKQAADFIRQFTYHDIELIATAARRKNPLSAGDVLSLAGAGNGNVSAEESVEEAIAAALSRASENDLILVTGSLYAAGEARAVFKFQRGLSGPS